MSKISDNIKIFRKKIGLKQSELGELIGKAPSVIANWEADTNRPDVFSIEKMCKIFDIDANTLFGWENKKTLYSLSDDLSEHELEVISAYRDNPDLQYAVDKILDIAEPGRPLPVKKPFGGVAAFGGGAPTERPLLTEQDHIEIENALRQERERQKNKK